MEIKYIDDNPIMSIEEQKIIVDWTIKNYHRFNKTGQNRQMQQMDQLKDIPSIVWDIKQRIIELEKLHEYRQEPMFRDAIGYMSEGGQLHKHTDPNKDGLIHTRFNVYVQIPEKGGLPVYANKKIVLKERNYICCRSGLDLHYCELVEGPKARIILSYGFLLPFEKLHHLNY